MTSQVKSELEDLIKKSEESRLRYLNALDKMPKDLACAQYSFDYTLHIATLNSIFPTFLIRSKDGPSDSGIPQYLEEKVYPVIALHVNTINDLWIKDAKERGIELEPIPHLQRTYKEYCSDHGR